MTTLKFFWNGIKANGGKLQRCHYSDSQLINHPAGTLTIYARDYERFSAEVREHFQVQNDSDSMTDYFENDRIRVAPEHPLYAQVIDALNKQKAHGERRHAKYCQRHGIAQGVN